MFDDEFDECDVVRDGAPMMPALAGESAFVAVGGGLLRDPTNAAP